MSNAKQSPANIVIESYQLMGARQMLQRILDSFNIKSKEKQSKDDDIYIKAELSMILSSMDNTRHFLCGDCRVHYKNHQCDKKGRLIKVEAYYAP